jgi:hypothetical protein
MHRHGECSHPIATLAMASTRLEPNAYISNSDKCGTSKPKQGIAQEIHTNSDKCGTSKPKQGIAQNTYM